MNEETSKLELMRLCDVSRETFLINAHFLESLSISTNFNSGFFSRAIIARTRPAKPAPEPISTRVLA